MHMKMALFAGILTLAPAWQAISATPSAPGAVADPFPESDRMGITDAIFPQTASWENLDSVREISAATLSAAIQAKMLHDMYGDPDPAVPCKPPDELPADKDGNLHAGDFFGPGDDDAILTFANFCGEGYSTILWRHLHDFDKMNHIVTAWTIDAIKPGTPPNFLIDNFNDPEMTSFVTYALSADPFGRGGPAETALVMKDLIVPKSASVINGELTLTKSTMLMWEPEDFDPNNSEMAGEISNLEQFDGGADRITAPPGVTVREIRRYKNSAGETWLLVALEGNPYGKGGLVGWIRK